MHSGKLYCTTGSFIAQQKVLLHSKKVSLVTETGEKFLFAVETGEKLLLWQKQRISTMLKFLLRQKLEKSSFCGKNWRKVTSAAEIEDKHHVLPAISVFLADEK